MVRIQAQTVRLFTEDQPSQPSSTPTVYFASVLACLGTILWLMPG